MSLSEEERLERKREARRGYYQKNKEKRCASSRAYRARNVERARENCRKWHAANSDRAKESSRKSHEARRLTLEGRARSLYRSAYYRAKKKDWLFDITEQDIIELLEPGCCSRTGLPFRYDKPPKGRYAHPLSPSIDRLDSFGIYTKSNIQIVCSFYNVMKSQMTDDELYEFCKRIIDWREGMELLK